MTSPARTLLLCVVYIALSATLIQFNKWLINPARFPHAMLLTTIHMVTTLILCNLFYYVCPGMYPSMSKVAGNEVTLIKSFVPLGLLFAVGLFTSNQAYLYCNAAFLQFMKEANIVLVFCLSAMVGLTQFSRGKFLNIFWIIAGAAIAVTGEVHFAAIGFVCQVISQCAECGKNVMGEWIMTGSKLKLDPLTYTMFMAPVCLCFLLIGNYFSWDQTCIRDVKAWWVYLIPNACLAFVLNISISVLIKEGSAMAFILSGLVKDVAIVLVSARIFHERVVLQQYFGFAICLSGVFFWSYAKVSPNSPVVAAFNRLSWSNHEDAKERAPLIDNKHGSEKAGSLEVSEISKKTESQV